MFIVKIGLWSYGLMGVFGLVLASVGLAGVTAYSVSSRTHEIGIRLALGARSKDILRMIMAEGAMLIVVGSLHRDYACSVGYACDGGKHGPGSAKHSA